MRPYKPSGKSDSGALLVLVVAVVVAGAAVGALANVVGTWFRLLILFPLAMGLVVGVASAWVVGNRRVRAPLVAAVIALAGGLVAWGTDFGVEFVRGRAEIRQQCETVAADVTAETGEPVRPDVIQGAANAAIAAWDRGEELSYAHIYATLLGEAVVLHDDTVVEPLPAATTGQALQAWMSSAAREGTVIGRAGREGGSNVGEVGTYILWGVELILVGATAAVLAYRRASEPFCEVCGDWYASEARVAAVGGTEAQDEVFQAVESGSATGLAQVARNAQPSDKVIALRVRDCARCASEPHFVEVVRFTTRRGKVHEKVLRDGLVPAEVSRSLLQELERAAQTEEAMAPAGA